MQVANDAASAKELPSCEARPGRRVNNSAAGKLQGGELREDCVERSGALSLAESAAFVAYEASAVSALEAWSAVMPASRLASCAATKASVARPSKPFAILVSTSSGSPSTVESREASALASALPRRAASRAAVVTAFRRPLLS